MIFRLEVRDSHASFHLKDFLLLLSPLSFLSSLPHYTPLLFRTMCPSCEPEPNGATNGVNGASSVEHVNERVDGNIGMDFLLSGYHRL